MAERDGRRETELVAALAAGGWRLATAESCTGGLLASRLTDVPGASAVFDLGVVTYANEMKRDILSVAPETLARFGAVSEEAVVEMARGVRSRAGATLGLAISGVAGPSGGSPDKPVGTVHFALAWEGGLSTLRRRFRGGRLAVKRQAVETALDIVRRYLDSASS